MEGSRTQSYKTFFEVKNVTPNFFLLNFAKILFLIQNCHILFCLKLTQFLETVVFTPKCELQPNLDKLH